MKGDCDVCGKSKELFKVETEGGVIRVCKGCKSKSKKYYYEKEVSDVDTNMLLLALWSLLSIALIFPVFNIFIVRWLVRTFPKKTLMGLSKFQTEIVRVYVKEDKEIKNGN